MHDDFVFKTGYKVMESHESGIQAIQLTDDPYNGIIFSYGKVEFPEDKIDDDGCTLSFDYEIHDDAGIEYDKGKLETYLGDFLVELIMFGLSKNEIVYSGGTDENRAIDTE